MRPFPRVQSVEVTDENGITRKAQMSPGFLIGNLALGDELILFRIGFDQTENSPLVKRKDFVSLGNHAPVFAEALGGCPFGITRCDVNAGKTLVSQVQIDVPTDHDWTGHVSFGFVGPDLLEFAPSSLRRKLLPP